MNKRQKDVFRGDRMREQRDRRGLTQTQLAEMIHGKQPQIKDYELNRRVPQADTLARICTALECSADYLLELSDQPGEQMPSLSSQELALLDVIKNGVSFEALQALMAFLKGGDE